MILAAVGIALVTIALVVVAYILFVAAYWFASDDPAAPVGTVRDGGDG